MKNIMLVTVVTFLAFNNNVYAEGNIMPYDNYFQIDAMGTLMEIETSLSSSEFSSTRARPSAIGGTYGKAISKNVAVEGVFAFGLGDGRVGTSHIGGVDTDVTAELNTMFGFFLNWVFYQGDPEGFRIIDRAGMYAKIGVVQTDIDFTAGVFGLPSSESYDDSGIAWGVGFLIKTGQAGVIVFGMKKYPDIYIGGGDKMTMQSIDFSFKMNL